MDRIHPILVIQKHCLAAKVNPIEMLGFMLEGMQSSHLLSAAASGFVDGAQNRSSVFADIRSLMGLMQKEEEPVSLLAAIELSVQSNYYLDSANSQNQNAPQSERDYLKHRANVHNTMLLILRELINHAETQALQGALRIEEMFKNGDLKKRPKDEEPGGED